ncbi:NUDIX hydrolase [Pedobacter sp. HMWF019]|uniref:NUDIX domain-containing protein n=1 Tax=Pedobacter sp. HMWF019 TaxID=2056856 RepID=UPI000D37DCFC|nr:NUDIX domain-containing protein [Pedobacter sp. HMWF019]PTS99332.1 NUDIX hydrolase [Pedobacter sp. HMWF019]
MGKISAGILLYKKKLDQLQVLLVHPGGPFFKNKDAGWWTIPKGESENDEELLKTALREFQEETGYVPSGNFRPLNPIIQKGGKTVYGWAIAGELEVANIVCNTFDLEWPPKSGKIQQFPEIDQARWFDLAEARLKINERQIAFLDELMTWA